MQALRVAPDRSGLVSSLASRATAKGLGDHYGRDAARLYADRIVPALDRQIEAVRKVRATAQHAPGVSRFPRGAEFYAANLHYTTTTNMTPAEVHQLGLDEAREIGARLDTLLKAQGLTKGSIGERVVALYKDPSLYYPNTPTGKAQLLAYLQSKIAAVRERLPRVFDRIPGQSIEVRAVPPENDAGSTRRLFPAPGPGRIARRHRLLQSARHCGVAPSGARHHGLSRRAAGASAPDGAGAAEPGDPFASATAIPFGLRRRLGALRRATGRRTRHVRERTLGAGSAI